MWQFGIPAKFSPQPLIQAALVRSIFTTPRPQASASFCGQKGKRRPTRKGSQWFFRNGKKGLFIFLPSCHPEIRHLVADSTTRPRSSAL